MCIEKTCKTCINLCNKRGEVCNLYKGEVQEMIKEIDRKLTVEEAVRIIKEEGYMDFERTKISHRHKCRRDRRKYDRSRRDMERYKRL